MVSKISRYGDMIPPYIYIPVYCCDVVVSYTAELLCANNMDNQNRVKSSQVHNESHDTFHDIAVSQCIVTICFTTCLCHV